MDCVLYATGMRAGFIVGFYKARLKYVSPASFEASRDHLLIVKVRLWLKLRFKKTEHKD